ncbi:MAG: hypothetical protein JJ879_01410 [Sneathiella sp.]|nr:hypothetical protein [Sneathiella sp.]
MTDEQNSSPKPPHLAGKVIIPDLSGVAEAQTQNVKTMGEVVETVTETFRNIASGHQTTLQESLSSLSAAMTEASNSAGMPTGVSCQADVQLKSMENAAGQFVSSANKITEATNQSHEKLNQAVAQSIAKIEEAAKKFSGG